MRSLLTAILLVLSAYLPAQVPAVQWQKTYGGSGLDVLRNRYLTSDGGFLLVGLSTSSDGDVSGNSGREDAWIAKINAAGIIQWQRNFGGSDWEEGVDAIETSDGGYLLSGFTYSTDGDVVGNHGRADLWLVKLNSAGIKEWSKCYGGTDDDIGAKILTAGNNGYVVYGHTYSNNEDVSGSHGEADIWILNLDIQGNIIWQKCFGGPDTEGVSQIIQTADGGYFMAGTSSSSTSGQVLCNTSNSDTWLVKLDMNWNIEWQQCWGGNSSDTPISAIQTPEGDFLVTGFSASTDLQGGPVTPAFILRIDPSGNITRQGLFGGSNQDWFFDIKPTPDGGCILGGFTASNDGDICLNKGYEDWWIVKLNSQFRLEWQKSLGGSFREIATNIDVLPGGGYMMFGSTDSNDGDITGNVFTWDFWVVKLGYPGPEFLPTINITSDETSICPGKTVMFVASITGGGTVPSFQWTVNGTNTGSDNDTIILNSLNNGDVIRCMLTSDDPCVTDRTASSNSITIHIDPALIPTDFLEQEIVLCKGKEVELTSSRSFASYLWSNNSATPSITVRQPGIYWLEAVSASGCAGTDTVFVVEKECIKRFYVPSAFTPNGDGKNEVLRPILEGQVLQYNFTIYNRWGQVVLQTTKPGQGWDGTFNGKKQNNDVFIWTVSYQFAGEEVRFEKGTVTIIR